MPALKKESTQFTASMDSMRRFFDSGATISVEFRKAQLGLLRKLVEDNAEDLTDAINMDIRRSKPEGYIFEILQIYNEIDTFVKELDDWTKPQRVKITVVQALDKAAYTKKDPLGLVLIISPWNYPVNLMFMPLVGAMGAGNCVVIKPSEVAPKTSGLIAKLIPKYFASDYIRVIEGGVNETTELLKERFDHIFYTGAPAIGKIVMAAAAKHLTPVTLELGGKCPAIIDRGLKSMEVIAKRIAWGKYISCGQTCLAPDHILCFEEDVPALVAGIKKAVNDFYGDNPQASKDYARIISQRHFDRVAPLLHEGGGKLEMGGKTDRSDLYIAPAILTGVSYDDKVMEEEIFGPILPIVTIKSIDHAVELINSRSIQGHKPLAVYIFSQTQSVVDSVLSRTSSGGCTVNDVILHMGLDTLPFGGVGYSGMGRYHGKFSMDTFSHEKAILHRNLSGEAALWMRYPPYDDKKLWWAKQLFVKRAFPSFAFLKFLPILLVGILIGYYMAMRK